MAGGIKMKKSRELNMSIPEVTDKIDVREISENFEIIDKILSANLFKRNTSTTEINVTAYPPYYIMKNTEDNPIDYFDSIFEETFTLGPLEEKKFFINAPQSVYITSDVQIEYDYFIPAQEAINDISPDYDNLDNKPQINGNVLSGDKTASELGLADINDIPDISASATNGNIKINGTETPVYKHPAGTNPHGTTKSDVGLGNVPNVATNDQTPSYTEASSLAKLTSGEKLSVAFGKISKAVTDLISHLADSVKHITSTERTNWNAAKTKADTNETNISNVNTQIADIYNRCGGGKNLFKTPTNVSSVVYSGLTFSWDSDGVLTVTGIPSIAADIYIPQYPYITTGSQFTAPCDCILHISYSETHDDMWISVHGYSADGQQFYKSSSAMALSAGDRIAGLYFRPTNTTTNYNFTVKFMIIPNGIGINANTYVPYIPTNAEIHDFLAVKTYGGGFFATSLQGLVVREQMSLKESGYAWVLDFYVTTIGGVEANTKTKLGTVTPAPPRVLVKHNVTIMKNDNSGVITNDAIIEITRDGSLYITSPVALSTSNAGRILSNGTCIFEAIKL